MFSDMLGNHRILAATNLLVDLRNSDYLLSYEYLPNRIGTASGVTVGLAVTAGGLAAPRRTEAPRTLLLRAALAASAGGSAMTRSDSPTSVKRASRANPSSTSAAW